MSTVADNLDINTVIACAGNYANKRNTIVFRLMPVRPIAELREAIDLFRAFDYHSCAALLIEDVLCRDTTADYYHMALCYISRCFARSGDLASARRIASEIAKVQLPATYKHTATMLLDEVQRELSECERKLSEA